MRTEVQNQVRMLGNAVAAELVSPRATHRRWMMLSPVHERIQVTEVEVPLEVDPAEYPKADEVYEVVARESFDSLGEAIDALLARGIDTDTFDAIWKTENPF